MVKDLRKKTGSRRKKTLPSRKAKFLIIALSAIFSSVLIFLLIKSFSGKTETFDSNKYFVKGIDVSHHNPILDWKNVKLQNISFAYLKATEGNSHIDRNYPYNYDLATKAGVATGAYHFYTFALSGEEQARHFLKTAKFASGDLLPAIDVEHSPANPYSKDEKYRALVVNELKVLENELYEHFGIHPVIYTNRDCYKHYIKGHFPDNIIWICDLDKEPGEKLGNWRIWQFSHKGELAGVDGHIDLNYYRYSYEEFKELLLP
ncbi:glycoside hydrolase family 25 protein [Dysgonomonas sp. 511]|uniref:glycoside hydrolase family 25 protein n=1 Tax=Dysgonomonas sp. 511 TaxID=2302930 RepID=UPI0013D2957B|nr:GH25 family lysozyme [Dysgonomonas sp. 511]NDV78840.1 hypothetical protein [Dysgonomonas sp. 511]